MQSAEMTPPTAPRSLYVLAVQYVLPTPPTPFPKVQVLEGSTRLECPALGILAG